MELLCPLCLQPLEPSGDQRARCPKHGDHFKVLFSRQPFKREPIMTTVQGVSNTRPETGSLVKGMCPKCGKPYQINARSGGRQVTCGCGHTFQAASADEISNGYDLVESDDRPQVPSRPRLTIPCVQHRDVMAVAQCAQCGAGVCETCDFAYPGGVHLCPTCATNPVIKLSSKRKALAIWSIVMGGVSTASICCAFLMYAVLADNPEAAAALDILFSWGMLVTALVGLGLGISSRSSHSGNPAITYVGWIWCTIMLSIYGLLIIVGIAAGG